MDETKPQGKAWEYDPAKLIGITNHFPTVNGNMFYSPLSLFLHILRTSIYFLQELLFEDGPTKRTGQNAIIWSSLNMIISGASLRGWWQNNGKSMRQWSGRVKPKTMLCLRNADLGHIFLESWFGLEHFYLEISTSSSANVSALLLCYLKCIHYSAWCFSCLLWAAWVQLCSSYFLFLLLPDCGESPFKSKGKASLKSWV